jgi:hypothetical protein
MPVAMVRSAIWGTEKVIIAAVGCFGENSGPWGCCGKVMLEGCSRTVRYGR